MESGAPATSPVTYLFTTTRSLAPALLKSAWALTRDPNVRVIILAEPDPVRPAMEMPATISRKCPLWSADFAPAT